MDPSGRKRNKRLGFGALQPARRSKKDADTLSYNDNRPSENENACSTRRGMLPSARNKDLADSFQGSRSPMNSNESESHRFHLNKARNFHQPSPVVSGLPSTGVLATPAIAADTGSKAVFSICTTGQVPKPRSNHAYQADEDTRRQNPSTGKQPRTLVGSEEGGLIEVKEGAGLGLPARATGQAAGAGGLGTASSKVQERLPRAPGEESVTTRQLTESQGHC